MAILFVLTSIVALPALYYLWRIERRATVADFAASEIVIASPAPRGVVGFLGIHGDARGAASKVAVEQGAALWGEPGQTALDQLTLEPTEGDACRGLAIGIGEAASGHVSVRVTPIAVCGSEKAPWRIHVGVDGSPAVPTTIDWGRAVELLVPRARAAGTFLTGMRATSVTSESVLRDTDLPDSGKRTASRASVTGTIEDVRIELGTDEATRRPTLRVRVRAAHPSALTLDGVNIWASIRKRSLIEALAIPYSMLVLVVGLAQALVGLRPTSKKSSHRKSPPQQSAPPPSSPERREEAVE